MSFWALALHKRGNSKNGGTRRGTRGDRRGTSTGVLRLRGTTVSKVPRAARADLTMHTSRVPLAFRLPGPFSPLLPLHLACLRLVPYFIPGNFCLFPSQLVRILFPCTPQEGCKASADRYSDNFVSYAHTSGRKSVARTGLNSLCKDRE